MKEKVFSANEKRKSVPDYSTNTSTKIQHSAKNSPKHLTHQTFGDNGQGQSPNGTGLGTYFPSMHHFPPKVLVPEERTNPAGTSVPQTGGGGACNGGKGKDGW